ncbi:hypothetical protein R1flu_026536 [Riccia fluitans]|uniref:Uncharacterized protein n=1 Tax=Riccia fluitans TaxID=41844 RepID=A0ABD1XKA2_9MARC
MAPHLVEDSLVELGGRGYGGGSNLLHTSESLKDKKRRKKKLSEKKGAHDRRRPRVKEDHSGSGSLGEDAGQCERKRRGKENDPQDSARPLTATDEVAQEELTSHIENPPTPPHSPVVSTSEEQFVRNLRKAHAIVPLMRGFEKIKKDVLNIMWRSAARYDKGRIVELERVENEIMAAAAAFLAGLAGRRTHTWQCELLKFNNMACKDPDNCWRRKFGEKVKKGRDTNDWTDFLREYETNVIFILSKWSVFIKNGSKAFPAHCSEIINFYVVAGSFFVTTGHM